ncbi:MAG: hypothetical protein WB795_21630 [Candidatus Acidiferrales bacterium]
MPGIAGVEIAARYLPMSAVAGDFYDFFTLEDNKLGFSSPTSPAMAFPPH